MSLIRGLTAALSHSPLFTSHPPQVGSRMVELQIESQDPFHGVPCKRYPSITFCVYLKKTFTLQEYSLTQFLYSVWLKRGRMERAVWYIFVKRSQGRPIQFTAT